MSSFFKRIVDIVLSIVILALASPVLIVAAIAIWLSDPGPFLYSQIREGQFGEPFRMVKLRTMYQNASEILGHHLATNRAAQEEWQMHLCLVRDPRLIRGVGLLLRKLSIDEIPNLWNVLRGEMSLVGPRPFTMDHVPFLDPQIRLERLTVLPGVTGLWQISGRGDADVRSLEQYDLDYLKKASFLFDLWIIVRTVPVVLSGKGAY
jgi:lipopolysaccharide/colanic/teichoic acid biosynthesis glycosyltransferase